MYLDCSNKDLTGWVLNCETISSLKTKNDIYLHIFSQYFKLMSRAQWIWVLTFPKFRKSCSYFVLVQRVLGFGDDSAVSLCIPQRIWKPWSVLSVHRSSTACCSLTQKWTLIRSTALDESADSGHCGKDGRVGGVNLNKEVMICPLCILSLLPFVFSLHSAWEINRCFFRFKALHC